MNMIVKSVSIFVDARGILRRIICKIKMLHMKNFDHQCYILTVGKIHVEREREKEREREGEKRDRARGQCGPLM